MFNHNEIVISIYTSMIVKVDEQEDEEVFSGVVLESGRNTDFNVGEYSNDFCSSYFELHHDLYRLQKLERIFSDEQI